PNRGLGVEAGPGTRVGVDGHHVVDHHITPEAELNVISGNVGLGVHAYSASVVAGNYIGIDATGTRPLGNTVGGVNCDPGGALIGTDGDDVGDVAERNVISANGGNNVFVGGTGNRITGNYIGTDATGTIPTGSGVDN